MSDKNKFRQQLAIIIATVVLLISAILVFAMMTKARFDAAQETWLSESQRASAIVNAMSELSRAIGYGGFIHNFKNLILRKDIAHYQPIIDQNIVDYSRSLDRLNELLLLPEDDFAIAVLRETLTEYANNYKLISGLIVQGKASSEIDAVVRVIDDPAFAASAHLIDRLKQRAIDDEQRVLKLQASAINFLVFGGIFLVIILIVFAVLLVVFLRRITDANAIIYKKQTQIDNLLDTYPDPMLSINNQGMIVRANQMAERFFGYTNAELLHMKVERLIPERFRFRYRQLIDQYFEHPYNFNIANRSTNLIVLAHGAIERAVEISLSYSGDCDHRLATIAIRDISERKQHERDMAQALQKQISLQNELVKAEKMVSLGVLVSGVAHEVNTPIGVSLTAATHLESETNLVKELYQLGELTEDGLTAYFDTAAQATQLISMNISRAADLIQSFKQVAVDTASGEQREFQLEQYLHEILRSLHPKLKQTKIMVTVECLDDIVVNTMPGALSQVITNLVMNSLIHAYDPEQIGCIRIIADQQLNDQYDPDWIRLIYHDDGKGIPVQIQDKVFDPFFTTARNKGGSGLGLYIVYNMVTQVLAGNIKLDSEPNMGTMITMYFPRVLSVAA